METVFTLKSALRRFIMEWRAGLILFAAALIVSLGLVLAFMRTEDVYDMTFYLHVNNGAPSPDNIINDELREWQVDYLAECLDRDEDTNRWMNEKLAEYGISEEERQKYFEVTDNVTGRTGDNNYRLNIRVRFFVEDVSDDIAIQVLEFYRDRVAAFANELTDEAVFGTVDGDPRTVELVTMDEPALNSIGGYSDSFIMTGITFASALAAYLAYCFVIYFFGRKFNSVQEFTENFGLPSVGVLTGADGDIAAAATKISLMSEDEPVFLAVVSQKIENSKNIERIAAAVSENGFKTLLLDARRGDTQSGEADAPENVNKGTLEGMIGAFQPDTVDPDAEAYDEPQTAGNFDLLAIGFRNGCGVKQKSQKEFFESLRAIAKEKEYDFVLIPCCAERDGKNYLGLAAGADAAIFEIDLRYDLRANTKEAVTDTGEVCRIDGVLFDNSRMPVFKRT